MSTESQSRVLLNRHRHTVKNRQQSLLRRTASEIGVDVNNQYWTTIQGKPSSSFCKTYDRSSAALS